MYKPKSNGSVTKIILKGQKGFITMESENFVEMHQMAKRVMKSIKRRGFVVNLHDISKDWREGAYGDAIFKSVIYSHIEASEPKNIDMTGVIADLVGTTSQEEREQLKQASIWAADVVKAYNDCLRAMKESVDGYRKGIPITCAAAEMVLENVVSPIPVLLAFAYDQLMEEGCGIDALYKEFGAENDDERNAVLNMATNVANAKTGEDFYLLARDIGAGTIHPAIPDILGNAYEAAFRYFRENVDPVVFEAFRADASKVYSDALDELRRRAAENAGVNHYAGTLQYLDAARSTIVDGELELEPFADAIIPFFLGNNFCLDGKYAKRSFDILSEMMHKAFVMKERKNT